MLHVIDREQLKVVAVLDGSKDGIAKQLDRYPEATHLVIGSAAALGKTKLSLAQLKKLYRSKTGKDLTAKSRTDAVKGTFRALEDQRFQGNLGKKPPETERQTAAAAKPAAPSKNGKPRTGVGAFIQAELLKGTDRKKIAATIPVKFPESKSTIKDVAWYAAKLKRDGKLS